MVFCVSTCLSCNVVCVYDPDLEDVIMISEWFEENVIPANYSVGFTGTRYGMSEPQKRTVEEFVDAHGFYWAHHGNCIGADVDFHFIARSNRLKVKLHPSINQEFQANCDFDEIAEPKEYLERNRDIVDEVLFLIATPKESVRPKNKRGGTWHTIRYAQQIGRKGIIVWPDGSVTW